VEVGFEPIISVLETWQALRVLVGLVTVMGIVLVDGSQTLEVVFKICLCVV
jgi:hypothetical protein